MLKTCLKWDWNWKCRVHDLKGRWCVCCLAVVVVKVFVIVFRTLASLGPALFCTKAKNIPQRYKKNSWMHPDNGVNNKWRLARVKKSEVIIWPNKVELKYVFEFRVVSTKTTRWMAAWEWSGYKEMNLGFRHAAGCEKKNIAKRDSWRYLPVPHFSVDYHPDPYDVHLWIHDCGVVWQGSLFLWKWCSFRFLCVFVKICLGSLGKVKYILDQCQHLEHPVSFLLGWFQIFRLLFHDCAMAIEKCTAKKEV